VSWYPVTVMLLVSLISYLDRNTLAILAPTILRETHLTAEQYGWIVSAFSVSYMAGNPVWGMIIDRFGLRRSMTWAVSIWTVASTAHAFVGSFLGFAAARALLGFGEGATFPGGLRTASETLPEDKRSRGIAVAYSGGSLGAIVTPFIVTPIALAYGWRAAFLFTGLAGVLWLALWSATGRKRTVLRFQPTAASPRPGLKDGPVWAFACLYAFGGLPLAFPLYAAPLYLSKVLGLPQGTIGKLIWLPPLGWELGYFFWGWINDRYASGDDERTRQVALRRCLALLTILSLPLALGARSGSVPVIMFYLVFAMFIASGFVIFSLSYARRIYRGHDGLIAGLGAGSWSALVACVMPVIGRLFDRAQYGTAFAFVTAFPIAGLIIWLVLSADRQRPAEKRR
jgi:MFS transporter, ACS family, hexuronate transporter